MTEEEQFWQQMAEEHPEFTKEHDAVHNFHAVREIVLAGSVTWQGVHARFKPAPGSKVMDIGANAGVYATYCALWDADVTAYEPHPDLFAMFTAMLKRTDLEKKIRVIPSAIWTFSGKTSFVGHVATRDDSIQYNGGLLTNGVLWGQRDRNRAVEVSCITLDEAIGDDEWDCVKMDIEGAEYETILAAPSKCLERIKFAYIEFHPWGSQALYGETLAKLCSHFRVEGVEFNSSCGRFEAAYLTRR